MAILIDGWSIVPQFRKCGKPVCKVCAAGKGHGPYYYGTKLIDGKKKSKYFGTHPPVSLESQGRSHIDNTHEVTQELRDKEEQLQQALNQLDALRQELSMLSKENKALKQQVSDLQNPVPQNIQPHVAKELTPDEVDTIWRTATQSIAESGEILSQAHQSLMHGLFPNNAHQTGLYKGKGNRLYICPFRVNKGGHGGQMRFSSAEKLVSTAIPWLIEQTKGSFHRKKQQQELDQQQKDSEKAQFLAKSNQELHELKNKMTHDLTTRDFTEWIISEEQMRRYIVLIDEVLHERNSK